MPAGRPHRVVCITSILLMCTQPLLAAPPTSANVKARELVRLDAPIQISPTPAPSPAGIPPSSQIVGVKTFTIPRWDGVKRDGQTAFTLTDLHITVYRLRLSDESFQTAAVVDFRLTNHTQNNKGTHRHQVHFNLLGASQNVLDPNQITVELERDTCTPSNPKVSGLHKFSTDIFSQIQFVSHGWSGRWNYEGQC